MSQRATAWREYAERWATLHGGYDPSRASPPVRGWLRLAYGLARVLAPLRVSPNLVTAFGLLLSVGVPVLAAGGGGWPLAASALVVGSSLADTVDGALAVITRRTSRLGQVYDSVADRVAEVCWLAAFTLLGAPVWLTVLGGGLAWLHEYVRARATVAGMSDIGAVTVAERPTRVLVAFFSLAVAGAGGAIEPGMAAGTATLGAAVWALLGGLGFVQLLAAVHRALRTRS